MTEGDAVQPAWSPNGYRIAYMARLDQPGQLDIRIDSRDRGRPGVPHE